jgi:hypothetical protein
MDSESAEKWPSIIMMLIIGPVLFVVGVNEHDWIKMATAVVLCTWGAALLIARLLRS